MAKEKAEYEPLADFKELAYKIVDRYPDRFSGIDLDRVQVYAIINKERKNDKLFEVHAVKMPLLLDTKFSHYLVVYASDWNSMDDKHRLLLVCQCLFAIPLDDNGEMETEKVNTFDMKDFSVMLRTFGTDYLVRDDIPHLLDEEVIWKDLF